MALLSLRIPNYTRIGARIRAELDKAAEQSAKEDITNRAALMRSGLAPDGSAQQPSHTGRTPLVRSGKLASLAGWVVRQQGRGWVVSPVADRIEPVQRLERQGYKIMEIASKTRAGGRDKIARIVGGFRP